MDCRPTNPGIQFVPRLDARFAEFPRQEYQPTPIDGGEADATHVDRFQEDTQFGQYIHRFGQTLSVRSDRFPDSLDFFLMHGGQSPSPARDRRRRDSRSMMARYDLPHPRQFAEQEADVRLACSSVNRRVFVGIVDIGDRFHCWRSPKSPVLRGGQTSTHQHVMCCRPDRYFMEMGSALCGKDEKFGGTAIRKSHRPIDRQGVLVFRNTPLSAPTRRRHWNQLLSLFANSETPISHSMGRWPGHMPGGVVMDDDPPDRASNTKIAILLSDCQRPSQLKNRRRWQDSPMEPLETTVISVFWPPRPIIERGSPTRLPLDRGQDLDLVSQKLPKFDSNRQ